MDKMKLLNRAELKHDVDYLNQANQLRQAADDGDKKARKYLKLKTKHERNYEEET
jgi:hypothetical protein